MTPEKAQAVAANTTQAVLTNGDVVKTMAGLKTQFDTELEEAIGEYEDGKKIAGDIPALYQALGIFLPLITTNCAVLGVAILVIQKDYNLLESVVYAFSTALGFALALIVFAGIREQQALVRIPKGMQGVAIVMVTAALLSLAFMGFSGVDGGLKSLFGLE